MDNQSLCMVRDINFSKASSDIFLVARRRVWMVTFLDVLHCFYVPDFFNKVDVVLGRLMNTFLCTAHCEGPRFVPEWYDFSNGVSEALPIGEVQEQAWTAFLFSWLPFHDFDSFWV